MLLVFAAGCVAGSRSSAVPSARAEDEVVGPRWAYYCFQEGNAEQVNYKANAAGARGWELVTAGPGDDGVAVWCFRQPRP